MKKVIIKLIVAVLVIALAVLGVYFIFFNLNATQTAYKALEKSFDQGNIQTLSTNLLSNDLDSTGKESDTFYGSLAYIDYKTYADIVTSEIATLEKSYIKLHYISNVSDDSMSNVSEKISQLDESLTLVNEKIEQLNKFISEGSSINKETYLDNTLNVEIKNALSSIIDVNEAVNTFLLNKYYDGVYNDVLFLNTLQTQIAKKFYSTFKDSERVDSNSDILTVYKELSSINSQLLPIYGECNNANIVNEWYSVYSYAKKINIGKLILNCDDYITANQENSDISKSIAVVGKQINAYGKDVIGTDVNIIDSTKLQELISSFENAENVNTENANGNED